MANDGNDENRSQATHTSDKKEGFRFYLVGSKGQILWQRKEIKCWKMLTVALWPHD